MKSENYIPFSTLIGRLLGRGGRERGGVKGRKRKEKREGEERGQGERRREERGQGERREERRRKRRGERRKEKREGEERGQGERRGDIKYQ